MPKLNDQGTVTTYMLILTHLTEIQAAPFKQNKKKEERKPSRQCTSSSFKINNKQQQKAKKPFTYFPALLDCKLIFKLGYTRQVYRAWKQTELFVFLCNAAGPASRAELSFGSGFFDPGKPSSAKTFKQPCRLRANKQVRLIHIQQSWRALVLGAQSRPSQMLSWPTPPVMQPPTLDLRDKHQHINVWSINLWIFNMQRKGQLIPSLRLRDLFIISGSYRYICGPAAQT